MRNPLPKHEPWDTPIPADTLDEALARRCKHCNLPISEVHGMVGVVWRHNNGMYTCGLPDRYDGANTCPIQFAEPNKF